MKLHQNVIFSWKYRNWTLRECFFYFLRGVSRELNIAPSYFLKKHENVATKAFRKRWFTRQDNRTYFDIHGSKLPDISDMPEKLHTLIFNIFDDIFLVKCGFNGNYNKAIVDFIDPYMIEGPYGYSDGTFDVTVKAEDTVIDAGAWIGDFSAYAASKGAKVYAFEPVEETFEVLRQTSALNNDLIYPVKMGLGEKECEIEITLNDNNSGANSIISKTEGNKERIRITTLDMFVEENKLERVDFIKADIEGAERGLLRGATNVLKTFAPKLALCTYHLPDDPEVLEQIIKEANPAYKVVQLSNKLLAAVEK
jgi:FkbM family methyltransferase